ncbi:hypothetical protein JXI42_09440 [bacterium]|nr:hypothetical protein [bacterium]
MKFYKTLLLLAISILLITLCCSKDDENDQPNEYPTRTDPFEVTSADSADVSGQGILTLIDGTELTVYGSSGLTVFMKLDISERDPVPDKVFYQFLSDNHPDSMLISGPIPSNAVQESLVVIWECHVGTVNVVEPSIAGGTFTAIVGGFAQYIELAWPWQDQARKNNTSLTDVTLEDIPYYEQYSTPHCWAAVTAMLDHYYYNLPEAWISTKFWEVAGRLGWADGTNTFSMRLGWAYSNFVSAQVGVDPYIYVPWFPSSLRKYLHTQVIDNDRVVGLFMDSYEGPDAHMVLVVGIANPGESNEILIIHDPSEVENGMYKQIYWHELITNAHDYGDISYAGSFRNYYMAVVVPKAESEARKTATLSIGYPGTEPYGTHLDPDTSSRELGLRRAAAKLEIDVTQGGEKGYRWVGISGGVLPTISNEHNLHPWVRVYNANETDRNLQLHSSIYQNSTRLTGSNYKPITVPAKSWIEDINDTLVLDGIITQPGEYELKVDLYGETMLDHHDQLNILFVVDTIITDSEFDVLISPSTINVGYGQDVNFEVTPRAIPGECWISMEIYLDDTTGIENYLGFALLMPDSVAPVSIDGCFLDEFEHGICPGSSHELIFIFEDYWGCLVDIYEVKTIPLNFTGGLTSAWDFYDNPELEVDLDSYSEFFRPITVGSNSFSFSYDTTYRDSMFDDTMSAYLEELPPGDYILEYTYSRHVNVTVNGCDLTGELQTFLHVIGLDMHDPVESEEEHDEQLWYLMDSLSQNHVTFSGPVRIGVGCPWLDSCSVAMWFEEGDCIYSEADEFHIKIDECRDIYWWYNDTTDRWVRVDSSFSDRVIAESADTTRPNVTPWIGAGDFKIEGRE